MPIPDAELPPIVENGDGLFSDLESDLARELLAAREVLRDLMGYSVGRIDSDMWGADFYAERGGKSCLVCWEKSAWNDVGRPTANHDEECAVRRARALLPEEPSDAS